MFSNLRCGVHQNLCLLDRRNVDQLTIKSYGAAALFLRFFHRIKDGFSLSDRFARRAERVIRQIDLRRVNSLFPFAAEHRCSFGLRNIAISIANIAKRAVDRA